MGIMVAVAFAILASGCKPDLTAVKATVNWNNAEQSASITIKNRGMVAAAAFDLQVILEEQDPATGPEIVHSITVNGLAAGESLEFRNLSLRHLLRPENDCLGRVAEVVVLLDPVNAIQEWNEGNNRKAVKVPAAVVDCGEMVRFESLAMGIEFTPISHIASDGVGFAIRALPDGGDFATIRRGLPVGNGQVIWLKNVWLEPKLCMPRHYIAFDVGYYGGAVYLEVNGDTGASPYPDIAAIDGITIGGVAIDVGSSEKDIPGVWQFNGVIHSIKIGGQDLAIDNMLFWTQQKRML